MERFFYTHYNFWIREVCSNRDQNNTYPHSYVSHCPTTQTQDGSCSKTFETVLNASLNVIYYAFLGRVEGFS